MLINFHDQNNTFLSINIKKNVYKIRKIRRFKIEITYLPILYNYVLFLRQE